MPNPSRNARRNQRKRLAHSLQEAEASHLDQVCYWLARWRREARRRAQFLGAPAAWRLITEPAVQRLVAQLDPSGELAQELGRVCAEAVAWASGSRLLGDGLRLRPVARRQEQ
jgi:hypothetical protein